MDFFPPSMPWLDRAACVDMTLDDFFVEAGEAIEPEVLAVCRRCPVRQDCVEWAYERSPAAGYFGGLSPTQRRSMTLEEATELIRDDGTPSA